MAGGWRATARMVATAVAAAAVTRAADSVRRLLAEATPPYELDRPSAPSFLEPPVHLTAAAPMQAHPAADDPVVAAQARPPHEYGPTPIVVPSHGIGFRSEPRRAAPVAEMPVISVPSGDEPEDRDGVAPAEPVVMPESVRTAAAIVQELEDDEPPSDREAEEPADLEDEPEPVRALRLTDPVEDDPVDAPVENLVDAPVEDDPVDAPVEDFVEPPVQDLVEPQPGPEPAVDAAPEAEEPGRKTGKGARKGKGKHRRHTSAISGTVRSSRGRGLSGMRVAVVDDHESVVATAVTGSGGAFVVEELPAGTYRLTASDEADGDFVPGWHGGKTFAKADPVKVKDARTRRKVDVMLVSAAAVEVDVDVRKKKTVVEVTVIDRATGTPAEGTVRVSTKRLSAELPLDDGRTAVTLRGRTKGSPGLGRKVRVDYSGSTHTRPASAKAKLR